MENIGLCIGTDGCLSEDVFKILQKPEEHANLQDKLYKISSLLNIPIVTFRRFQKQAERSSTPPLEMLNQLVLEWIQRETSSRSFLLYFIDVLEKSDCGDMAAHLRQHFNIHFSAPNYIRAMRNIGDVNEEDFTTNGNSRNRLLNSIPPLALAWQEDKQLLDKSAAIPSVGTQKVNSGSSRCSRMSHWMFHTLQLVISVSLLVFSILSLYGSEQSQMQCPKSAFEHTSWLNVTNFREYESQSYLISPEEGIKLNIQISSLHDWPPGSVLWNPCNIVELHLSGIFDDLVLLSLSQQLHQVELITVENSNCLEYLEAYVNKKPNYGCWMTRKPTKLKKICTQQNTTVPTNNEYESITVYSYREYKLQLSGIPPNVFMDVTLNITEPSGWPTTLGQNELLRVKKLTLIGPFLRKSFISILQHSGEIEEIYIFNSKTGLCEMSASWDSTNKPPDIRFVIDLVKLKILGLVNFEKCKNIFNLLASNIRTGNLHTFKLDNIILSDSNVRPVQTFLQSNSRSLQKLKFVFGNWNVSLFQNLNTKFPKISDIEIDFVNGNQVTNFFSGLLCDDVFPFLNKLLLANGYLPYDDINIILKCNSLNYLDFGVYVPQGMEPLRMNIFKSVIRLPHNFTLGLFFDGKGPTDFCKVELISGIDFLPNCQLLEVES